MRLPGQYLHGLVGAFQARGQLSDFLPRTVHAFLAASDLRAGLAGMGNGMLDMHHDVLHRIAHALHRPGHLRDFRQLMLGAFLQRVAGLGQLLAQLTQTLRVTHHAVHQGGDLHQKLIEALCQRHMHSRLVTLAGTRGELGRGRQHLVQHVLALHRIGLAVHRQIEQRDRLHHHIKSVNEHHRPATVMGHHKHRKPLMLQRMKHHVMQRNRHRRHQNRQPVPIKRQHCQQRKNPEVRLNDPLGLIDMQRRHHHQTHAQQTTHQPRSADGSIQQRQQHTGATAHQQRLLQRVVPERQADSEREHQPDQAQHDAVGFAVVVEETRGEGHVRLLHVNEPEKAGFMATRDIAKAWGR
ncbi:hypothetical protein D3C87_1223450 [compost metagenome]